MAKPEHAGGLAAALTTAQNADTRRGCGVGRVLTALDHADHADLTAALAPDSGISGSVIARVLTARGYNVSGGTVQKHRGGACACPR